MKSKRYTESVARGVEMILDEAMRMRVLDSKSEKDFNEAIAWIKHVAKRAQQNKEKRKAYNNPVAVSGVEGRADAGEEDYKERGA